MKTERNRKLARIHIAKRDLGLDEETYRGMLDALFGRTSAKDLTDAELDQLIEHLVAHGWDGARRARRRRRPTLDPQSRKIWALWYRLEGAGAIDSASAEALAGFTARMTGKRDLAALGGKEKSKLIEALKVWLARTGDRGSRLNPRSSHR